MLAACCSANSSNHVNSSWSSCKALHIVKFMCGMGTPAGNNSLSQHFIVQAMNIQVELLGTAGWFMVKL